MTLDDVLDAYERQESAVDVWRETSRNYGYDSAESDRAWANYMVAGHAYDEIREQYELEYGAAHPSYSGIHLLGILLIILGLLWYLMMAGGWPL